MRKSTSGSVVSGGEGVIGQKVSVGAVVNTWLDTMHTVQRYELKSSTITLWKPGGGVGVRPQCRENIMITPVQLAIPVLTSMKLEYGYTVRVKSLGFTINLHHVLSTENQPKMQTFAAAPLK